MSKKKKKRLEKQRAKQRDSDSTSSTSNEAELSEEKKVLNLVANTSFALSALFLLAGMATLYMPGTTQSSGKVEPWVDAAAYSAMIIFPMVTASPR